MKYNINNKTFRSISNSANGEVNSETHFHYEQDGDVIFANYYGGNIVKGHLVGKQLSTGQLEFLYHHINTNGELMAGKCTSTPQATEGGKLKFIEKWQWVTGNKSEGESEIIEI
jgi:uncharacterized protein (AIM24 family)